MYQCLDLLPLNPHDGDLADRVRATDYWLARQRALPEKEPSSRVSTDIPGPSSVAALSQRM